MNLRLSDHARQRLRERYGLVADAELIREQQGNGRELFNGVRYFARRRARRNHVLRARKGEACSA